jgi:hypothetical protein
MIHRWASPALALLACVMLASRATSQVPDQRADSNRRWGALRQNEPNPFSRQTTIPFSVGDAECAVGTQQHVVTLRIYNILSQIVGTPVLVDSASTDQSTGTATATTNARPLANLSLPCGDYTAQWDGKHPHNDRNAAAGVYMYQLLIDGHPAGMKKMIIQR